MTIGTYEVSEISDAEAFDALHESWNGLLDQCACDLPFLRHEWLRLWWAHFGREHRLAIVTARRGGRLVLALPMMEVRQNRFCVPFVTLRSLTNAHSYRFEILVKPGEEASLESVWAYLRRRERPWDVVELQELSARCATHDGFLEGARGTGHPVGLWQAYESPFLELRGTWDAYVNGLRAKFRSNLRNRWKRLGKIGAVTNEVIRGGAALTEALDDAFRIERLGWKGEGGSAIASDPALLSFYAAWGNLAAERGWLRLWFLKVGGRRVAFEYDMEYKRTLYCLKIGYDSEMHPYSPGQLLKERVLERCFTEGVAEYDFLGEWLDAKRDWTSSARPHLWAYVYNRSLPAKLHHAYKFGLKQRVRGWMAR